MYQHGTVRAGFNAIVDAVRVARECGIPCYAVNYYCARARVVPRLCPSLQPLIPEGNVYPKYEHSAFDVSCGLAPRLGSERCRHLMVIGYDCDYCVRKTVVGAAKRGMRVVTSEHCMLTVGAGNRRESLAVFRRDATLLGPLSEVVDYLRGYSRV